MRLSSEVGDGDVRHGRAGSFGVVEDLEPTGLGESPFGGYDYSNRAGWSYIYGASTSISSAREARYDWHAWQLVVNTDWEFSTVRMSSTGQLGAPPMCRAGS